MLKYSPGSPVEIQLTLYFWSVCLSSLGLSLGLAGFGLGLSGFGLGLAGLSLGLSLAAV